MASGWNSSLSVRHSFQYRMEMTTMTTSRGITTPTTIHKFVFSVSEGADATFSTAAERSQTSGWNHNPFHACYLIKRSRTQFQNKIPQHMVHWNCWSSSQRYKPQRNPSLCLINVHFFPEESIKRTQVTKYTQVPREALIRPSSLFGS